MPRPVSRGRDSARVRRSRIALILSLAAALVPGRLAAQELRHADVPFPIGQRLGSFVEVNGETWVVHRAIDAWTGQPIAGAELFVIAERPQPIGGEFWYERRAASDADGFVRLRIDDLPQFATGRLAAWLMLRATTHGPVMEHRTFGAGVVRLARAASVPVRVVDAAGRPLDRTLVGLCGGCGHTPDLVSAHTGADGTALLAGVSPRGTTREIYCLHERLAVGSDEFDWLPGEPPDTLTLSPGVAMRGVVVDHTDAPVPGATIGARHRHRGPWARTREDGSFDLMGLPEIEDLWLHLPERRLLFYCDRSEGLRLGAPPADGQRSRVIQPPAVPPGRQRVSLVVRDRTTGARVEDCEFVVSGPLPQRNDSPRRRGWVEQRGWLLPGVYEARATSPTHALATRHIQVERGDEEVPTEFELLADALPQVIATLNASTGAPWIDLVQSAHVRRVTPGEPIAFDPQREATFRVNDGYSLRYFRYPPGTLEPGAAIELVPWPPTVVRGRVVDAAGTPVAASVALSDWGAPGERPECQTAPDGSFELRTSWHGLKQATFAPTDRALAARVVEVLLPERSTNARIEIPEVVLSKTPLLHVTAEDGEPIDGAYGALCREGFCAAGTTLHGRIPIEGGAWRGLDPRPGDRIVLLPPRTSKDSDARVLPYRFECRGPGPWQIGLPQGALAIDVRDEAGAPLVCHVLLGEFEATLERPTTLRRVPAGDHRLYVSAPGHRTAIVEVAVGETTVEVGVTLRRR